jgi:hypothetical protein
MAINNDDNDKNKKHDQKKQKQQLHDPNLPLKRAEAAKILATKYKHVINDPLLLDRLSPTQRAEYDVTVQFLEDTQYTYRSDGKPGKSGHTTAVMLNGRPYILEIKDSKPEFTETFVEKIMTTKEIWNESKQDLR